MGFIEKKRYWIPKCLGRGRCTYSFFIENRKKEQLAESDSIIKSNFELDCNCFDSYKKYLCKTSTQFPISVYCCRYFLVYPVWWFRQKTKTCCIFQSAELINSHFAFRRFIKALLQEQLNVFIIAKFLTFLSLINTSRREEEVGQGRAVTL